MAYSEPTWVRISIPVNAASSLVAGVPSRTNFVLGIATSRLEKEISSEGQRWL